MSSDRGVEPPLNTSRPESLENQHCITPDSPGPWRKGELGENQFDVYDANGDSIIEPSDRAEFVSHETAALAALAPEMAEAILAYGRNPSIADRRTVAEHDEVLRMAREIQEIADR